MDVDYTARATSDIRATAQTTADGWTPGDLLVTIRAYRGDGTLVVEGSIILYVAEKPK